MSLSREVARTNEDMVELVRAFGRELDDHAESYAAGIMDGKVGTAKLYVTATFMLDGESLPTITVHRDCLSMPMFDAFNSVMKKKRSKAI